MTPSLNPQAMRFAIKPKKINDDDFALSKKATIKVDISYMAHCIRNFYARKEMCKLCEEEKGKKCPYNYDIIACIYGEESIN